MSANTLAVLTIIAILLGPIIALTIQRWSDNQREATARKLWVFKNLMMNRATPVSPFFVQALNLIDVEFKSNSQSEKAVRAAWNSLLDHLTNTQAANWEERRRDLTGGLLTAMGKCLGYDFDDVYIKKHAYYPQGLGNVEEEQHALRRKVLETLDGTRRLPVAIFEQRFPDLALNDNGPQQ